MDSNQNNFDESSDNTNGRSHARQAVWLVLAGIVGLSLCLVATFFLLQGPARGLRPFRGAPTAISLIVNGEPVLVTFPELSENAAAFHNQRIRVTGFYLPLSLPDCQLINGPVFYWSLVSQGLQLNAQGFERALSIVSPATTLTVEGIWRLYQGPAGCGKEPETRDVWYLEVERIIQPNPLVAGTLDPAAYLLSGISTPIFPTVGPTTTPRPGVVAATPVPPGAATPTPGLTLTGTAVAGTPTPLFTPIGTPTSTSTGTITATATRPSGTLTATPTGTRSGTPGPTNTPLPVPTNPTTNPYPAPGSTLTPTPYPPPP